MPSSSSEHLHLQKISLQISCSTRWMTGTSYMQQKINVLLWYIGTVNITHKAKKLSCTDIQKSIRIIKNTNCHNRTLLPGYYRTSRQHDKSISKTLWDYKHVEHRGEDMSHQAQIFSQCPGVQTQTLRTLTGESSYSLTVSPFLSLDLYVYNYEGGIIQWYYGKRSETSIFPRE